MMKILSEDENQQERVFRGRKDRIPAMEGGISLYFRVERRELALADISWLQRRKQGSGASYELKVLAKGKNAHL
jgi:hypothetical protein